MILLDAIYINNSGGKVLLDYLVESLNKTGKSVFYLLDERVRGSFNYLPASHVQYLKASFTARHRFYKNSFGRFSCVLCFGNIPPSVKLTIPVYTYFQNTVYFYTTKDFKLLHRFILLTKAAVIRSISRNTTSWWVQTSEVKNMLQKYWKISTDKVECYPFYDDRGTTDVLKPVNYNNLRESFLYVSDGHPNKLHRNLLIAFKKVAAAYPSASLKLTISNQYPLLLQEIDSMRKEGLDITNLGWCNKSDLLREYHSNSFLVYPSNMESFGLGLIEAANCGMRILAANLPYVNAVISPSLSFDQENPDAIAESMIIAIQKDLPVASVVIENRIEKMLERLPA